MPEDLGELMGRAAADPVAPLDPDAVWRRGSRRRLARRAALALPIIVLVAVIGGLVVVSSDNDGGPGTDDSLFAGLTADQQSVVDEYLRVLEVEGALSAFADERAAVEYAWRVECFGAISPAQLNGIGGAVSGLVGALGAEAVASVALVEGVIDQAEVDDVRTVTDDAITRYHEVIDRDVVGTAEAAAFVNARDTVTTRLASQDVIRQAIDGEQVEPINAAIQLSEAADAALALLSEAARLSEDGALIRGWDAHHLLLQAELAAAKSAAATLDILRPPYAADEAALLEAITQEDQALSHFNERVSADLKVELRNATSTGENRAFQQLVDDLALALTSASPPAGSFEEAERAYQLSAEANLPAYQQVAEASVAGIVAAASSSDSARDAAVAAACDATGDRILAIDPAVIGGDD
jgi:hypothetical protein